MESIVDHLFDRDIKGEVEYQVYSGRDKKKGWKRFAVVCACLSAFVAIIVVVAALFASNEKQEEFTGIQLVAASGSGLDFSSGVDTLDRAISGINYGRQFSMHLPSRVHVQHKGNSGQFACISAVNVVVSGEVVDSVDLSELSQCGFPSDVFDYNEDLHCARLSRFEQRTPRDLTIDFRRTGCDRLSLWYHPDLGEPFKFNINLHSDIFQNCTGLLSVKLLPSGDVIPIDLDAVEGSNYCVTLNNTMNISDLPTSVEIVSEGSCTVSSVGLDRYGQGGRDCDMEELVPCVNTCGGVADENGLLFGESNLLSSATITLSNDANQPDETCEQLTEAFTSNGNQDTREVCSETVFVSNYAELADAFSQLAAGDVTNLTVYLENAGEPMEFPENTFLTVPTLLEVRIFDETAGKLWSNLGFIVEPFAFLQISGLDIRGAHEIVVEDSGKIAIIQSRFEESMNVILPAVLNPNFNYAVESRENELVVYQDCLQCIQAAILGPFLASNGRIGLFVELQLSDSDNRTLSIPSERSLSIYSEDLQGVLPSLLSIIVVPGSTLILDGLSLSRAYSFGMVSGGGEVGLRNCFISDILCGTGWTFVGDHSLQEHCVQTTVDLSLHADWTEAEQSCGVSNARLLSFDNAAVAETLANLCLDCVEEVWVGGVINLDGELEWTSSYSFSDYAHSVFNESSFYTPGYCVTYNGATGTLSSADCSEKKPFLCSAYPLRSTDQVSSYTGLVDDGLGLTTFNNTFFVNGYKETHFFLAGFHSESDDALVYVNDQATAFAIPFTISIPVFIEDNSPDLISVCEVSIFSNGSALPLVEPLSACQQAPSGNATFEVQFPFFEAKKIDSLLIRGEHDMPWDLSITVDGVFLGRFTTTGTVLEIPLSDYPRFSVLFQGDFQEAPAIQCATDGMEYPEEVAPLSGSDLLFGTEELVKQIHLRKASGGTTTRIHSVTIYTYGSVSIAAISLDDTFDDCEQVGQFDSEGFAEYIKDAAGVVFDKDFSADLLLDGCSHLSLWTHPVQPAAYTLQISTTTSTSLQSLDLSFPGASFYRAVPSAIELNSRVPLYAVTTLPRNILLSGSSSIVAVTILYYNESIAAFITSDVVNSSGCIKLCPRLLDASGQLKLQPSSSTTSGNAAVAEVTLALFEAGCELVSEAVMVSGENSEEACTLSKVVSEYVDVKAAVNEALGKYAKVEMTTGNSTVELDLQGDTFDVTSDLVVDLINLGEAVEFVLLRGGSVSILDGAVAAFEGIGWSTDSSLTVASGGSVTVDNGYLNGGEMGCQQDSICTFRGCQVAAAISLLGETSLSSTLFHPASSSSNISHESLTTDNLEIEFSVKLTADVSKVLLVDIGNDYVFVDGAEAAGGEENVTLTEVSGIIDCSSLCDEISSCHGIWYDFGSTCTLCLFGICQHTFPDLGLAQYFVKQPIQPYIAYEGCFADASIVHFLELQVELEECKVWCHYYTSCAAFVHDGSSCLLYEDNAVQDDCTELESIYVRQKESVLNALEDYVPLEKALRVEEPTCSRTDPLHNISSALQCSLLCDIHTACDSFEFIASTCYLHAIHIEQCPAQWTASPTLSNGILYSSVERHFPRYEYIALNVGCLPASSESTERVTVESECQELCDLSFTCDGYGFASAELTQEANCRLLNSSQMKLVYVSGSCESTAGYDIYLATSSTSYLQRSASAAPNCSLTTAGPTAGLIHYNAINSLARCQAVCEASVGCSILGFDNTQCYIPYPMAEACAVDNVILPTYPDACVDPSCYSFPSLATAAAKCLNLGSEICGGVVQVGDDYELRGVSHLVQEEGSVTFEATCLSQYRTLLLQHDGCAEVNLPGKLGAVLEDCEGACIFSSLSLAVYQCLSFGDVCDGVSLDSSGSYSLRQGVDSSQNSSSIQYMKECLLSPPSLPEEPPQQSSDLRVIPRSSPDHYLQIVEKLSGNPAEFSTYAADLDETSAQVNAQRCLEAAKEGTGRVQLRTESGVIYGMEVSTSAGYSAYHVPASGEAEVKTSFGTFPSAGETFGVRVNGGVVEWVVDDVVLHNIALLHGESESVSPEVLVLEVGSALCNVDLNSQVVLIVNPLASTSRFLAVKKVGGADGAKSSVRFSQLLTTIASFSRCSDEAFAGTLELSMAEDYAIRLYPDGAVVLSYGSTTFAFQDEASSLTHSYAIQVDEDTSQALWYRDAEVIHQEPLLGGIASRIVPALALYNLSSAACDVDLHSALTKGDATLSTLEAAVEEALLCEEDGMDLYQLASEADLEARQSSSYVTISGGCYRSELIFFRTEVLLAETCRALCDIHFVCIAYTFNAAEQTCRLYSALSVLSSCSDSGSSFYQPAVNLTVKNLDRDIYSPLPSGTCFAFKDFVNNTVTSAADLAACRLACFESSTCRGFSFDGVDECVLTPKASITSCASSSFPHNFVETFTSFHREAESRVFGNTPIASPFEGLGLKACKAVCEAFTTCATIVHGAISEDLPQACILLGEASEQLASFDANLVARLGIPGIEGESPVVSILNKFQVYLHTEVNLAGVCPRDEALVLTTSGLFELAECQALCQSHVDCGSLVYSLDGTCRLYDTVSFLRFDCAIDHFTDDQRFMLSFQRFAFPQTAYMDASGLCNAQHAEDQQLTLPSVFECLDTCSNLPSCASARFHEATLTCTLYALAEVELCGTSTPEGDFYVAYAEPVFSETETCLSGEPRYVFPRKSKEECAAVCDRYFDCTGFSLTQGFECLVYDTVVFEECGENVTGYRIHSDEQFTRLDNTFCVAAASSLIELQGIPEEGCKRLCDDIELCNAVEHDSISRCRLYSSTDFSVPCTDTEMDLFISYKTVVDPDREVYTFTPLEDTCFGGATLVSSVGPANSSILCKDHCIAEPACMAYQYEFATEACELLVKPGINEPLQGEITINSCGGFESAFKVKNNPYKVVPNAVLDAGDALFSAFNDKFVFECMALCDAHPFCRAFAHSDQLRTCQLFQVPYGGFSTSSSSSTSSLVIYVNSRSHIDSVTTLKEPETLFATLPGLSYSECAEACTNMDKCDAFVHTRNYRTVEDLLVAPTRVRTVSEPTYTLKRTGAKGTFLNMEPIRDMTDDSYSQHVHYQEYEGDIHDGNGRFQFSKDGFCFHRSCNLIEELFDCPIELETCTATQSDRQAFDVRNFACETYFLAYKSQCGGCPKHDTETIEGLPRVECSANPFSSKFCGITNPCWRCVNNEFRRINRQVDPACSKAAFRMESIDGDDCFTYELDKIAAFETFQPEWDGCWHDDKGVDWQWASARISLRPAASSSLCIAASSVGAGQASTTLQPCNIAPISDLQKWVYEFGTETWTIVVGGEKLCLAFDGGTIQASLCSSAAISDIEFQVTNGGQIVHKSSGLCLQGQLPAGSLTLVACNDNDDLQLWKRQTLCRLSTREKTITGQFVPFSSSSSCFRDPNNPAQCIDLYYEFPAASGAGSGRIFNSASTHCLVRGSNDVDTTVSLSTDCDSVFALWGVDGFFQNEFNFSNPISGVKLNLCGRDGEVSSSCSEAERRFGIRTASRAFDEFVEVAVDPSATVQAITDPELLFQIWLNSEQGQLTRSMISKVEILEASVDATANTLTKAQTAVDTASAVLAQVATPVSTLDSLLATITGKATALANIMRLGENLPYVGPVAKVFRITLSAAAKFLNNGGKVIRRGIDLLDKLDEPIAKMDAAINAAMDAIYRPLAPFGVLRDFLAKANSCAFFEGIEARLELVEGLIAKVISSIDLGQRAIEAVTAFFSAMNDLETKVVNFIQRPLRAVLRGLNPVSSVLKAFDFLTDIYTRQICLPLPTLAESCTPRTCTPRKCFTLVWKEICIPSICVPRVCIKLPKFVTKCFTLQDVGDFIVRIKNAIKSLPGVGAVFRAVDTAVDKAVEAVFGAINLPLPTMAIATAFIQPLQDKIETAVTNALAKAEEIANFAVSIPFQIDPFEKLQAALPDVFSCTSVECFASSLGFDFSRLFTDFTIDVAGFEISIEELIGTFSTVADKMAELQQLTSGIFEGFECTKEDTFELELAPYISLLGLDDITGESCSIDVPYCAEASFPGLEDAALISALEAIGLDIIAALQSIGRRRRLQGGSIYGCSQSEDSWGFSFSVLSPVASGAFTKATLKRMEDFVTRTFNKARFEVSGLLFDLEAVFTDPALKFVVGCDGGVPQVRLRFDLGLGGGIRMAGVSGDVVSEKLFVYNCRMKKLDAFDQVLFATFQLLDRLLLNPAVSAFHDLLRSLKEEAREALFEVLEEILDIKARLSENQLKTLRKSSVSEMLQSASLSKLERIIRRVRTVMENQVPPVLDFAERTRRRIEAVLDIIELITGEDTELPEDAQNLLNDVLSINCGNVERVSSFEVWDNADDFDFQTLTSTLTPGAWCDGNVQALPKAIQSLLESVEIHPTAYGNLFGSGVTGAVELAILRKNGRSFEYLTSEVSTPFVGPHPFGATGTAFFASMPVHTWIKQILCSGRVVQQLLIDKDEDRVAKKVGVSVNWGFPGINMHISGDLGTSDSSNICFAGGRACISVGIPVVPTPDPTVVPTSMPTNLPTILPTSSPSTAPTPLNTSTL